MKKTYIKPTQKVHNLAPQQIIAESLSTVKTTDSGNDLDGTNTTIDNTVWARQNNGSIMDNEW